MPYYDLKERRFVDDRMTGVIGHISFARLVGQLRISGEIAKNETITGIEIIDDMVRYRVELPEA